MKRSVPLLITALGGFVLIAAYFIPYTQSWGETVAIWFDILAAIAFILGGGNLLKVQLQKLSDRGRGWGYSAIVLVSFFSCLLSLQAAASRLLYAYARDEMIVGSGTLSKLSSRHVPTAALWVCGLAPAAISVGGYFLENALKTIVIFGSVGIYIGFQMVVLGALFARWRGWTPGGKFRLGGWAWPVNIGAVIFGVGAIINLVWPRTPNDAWYFNYGMLLTSAVVVGSGLLYMLSARPYDHGSAPHGDAHRLAKRTVPPSAAVAARPAPAGR